jgi:hypothetical protein
MGIKMARAFWTSSSAMRQECPFDVFLIVRSLRLLVLDGRLQCGQQRLDEARQNVWLGEVAALEESLTHLR